MSKSTWAGAVNSDWDEADNWSPVGVPGASSDVTIATGRAVASASIGTVNSITDSSDLRLRSAGTNTVATFLDNSGDLRVDRKGGAGGTILNVGGTLTNSGSLRMGNATLSAPDTVSAASLDNTGEIRLLGSSANQALLDVTGSAGFGTAEVLSGFVRLTGDSAIEFESGEITSLAAHAYLRLNGSDAFVEDSTALGKNSALAGLASIGAGATLDLENGASVSTTGSLANDGIVALDANRRHGGSSLTVGATLTNSGTLEIGNGNTNLISSVTANSFVNSGTVDLIGDARHFDVFNVSEATTNNGAISIAYAIEELAGAVGGAGSFSLKEAHLGFDSSVSAGQTITESGADGLTLKQAQEFAGTISGFGTADAIDATNFLFSGTTFNFAENSGGTGGTLTLHDKSQSLTANILMTGVYSNSDFTLAPEGFRTGTVVEFV